MLLRWAPLFLLLGFAVLGCGKGEDIPKLYPAKGKVVRNGKAVKGEFIQFRPVKDMGEIFINGMVGADGTFELSTKRKGDPAPGAPEGEYQVTYMPPGKDQSDPPVTPAKTYKVEPKSNDFTVDVSKK